MNEEEKLKQAEELYEQAEELYEQAEELYEQAEAYFEELEQQAEELATSFAELDKKIEEDETHIKRMHEAAQQELRTINKFHPLLNSTEEITCSCPDDFLKLRFHAPTLDWDDKKDKGMVTFFYNKLYQSSKTWCVAVSGGAIRDCRGTVSKQLIENVARSIASKLVYSVLKSDKNYD